MKQPNANANGFTLVEVMVAVVVLAVGMLAMAASTGYISAEIRSSTWNTQRTMAREQVIEQIRATPFDNISTSGSATVIGRYSMTWVVASVNNNLKTVQVIASGPAYRLGKGAKSTVVDTVAVRVSRP
jgi:prepilin-type N-terminal cleavage/methylation domain-containing protein